jgi:hypothetical protein
VSLLTRFAVGAAGVVITGLSGLWAAFRAVEWAAGVATMPGNVGETQKALANLLNRLSEQVPNTLVLVAVGCLFLFGLLMMTWAIRRPQLIQTSAANQERTPSPPDAPKASDPARDERLRMRKENERLALEIERMRLLQKGGSPLPRPKTVLAPANGMKERQAKHDLAVFCGLCLRLLPAGMHRAE